MTSAAEVTTTPRAAHSVTRLYVSSSTVRSAIVVVKQVNVQGQRDDVGPHHHLGALGVTRKVGNVERQSSLGGDGGRHGGEKDHAGGVGRARLGALDKERTKALGLRDGPDKQGDAKDGHDDDLDHEEVSELGHTIGQ